MNAHELTEWSTTDKKIERILKSKGYKKLGAGVDQTAYLEPGTGFVLKIFGTQGGKKFSRDHQMFFVWAQFCMKNSQNPFLPRFDDYESFVLDGDRYLQIRQEILQKTPHGIALEIMADAAEEDVRNLNGVYDFIDQYGYAGHAQKFNRLIESLGVKQSTLSFRRRCISWCSAQRSAAA